MKFTAYLYDAAGNDEKIEIEDIDIKKLGRKKLLWIDLKDRDEGALDEITKALELKDVPCGTIIDGTRRPTIHKFEGFFRFCIDSVIAEKDKEPEKISIDFIVGKNFVVTVHDDEIDYFKTFRKRENGETTLGELDAESFVAILLDLHIVSYFRALEEVDRRVDKLDVKVLKSEIETEEFIEEMVELRRTVSKLRRWLMPHRDVIYSLSRADFQQIAESDSTDQFNMLNTHFENAVDAIDSSRDTVLSTFELYATRSAHRMNIFIQRLTFLTLVIGSLGVVAGVLGMNYKVDFFDSSIGFWVTIAGMAIVALGLTVYARFRSWI